MTRKYESAAFDDSLDRTATVLDARDRGVDLVCVVYRQLQRWGDCPPGSLERLGQALDLLTATQRDLHRLRRENHQHEQARVLRFPGVDRGL